MEEKNISDLATTKLPNYFRQLESDDIKLVLRKNWSDKKKYEILIVEKPKRVRIADILSEEIVESESLQTRFSTIIQKVLDFDFTLEFDIQFNAIKGEDLIVHIYRDDRHQKYILSLDPALYPCDIYNFKNGVLDLLLRDSDILYEYRQLF